MDPPSVSVTITVKVTTQLFSQSNYKWMQPLCSNLQNRVIYRRAILQCSLSLHLPAQSQQ